MPDDSIGKAKKNKFREKNDNLKNRSAIRRSK